MVFNSLPHPLQIRLLGSFGGAMGVRYPGRERSKTVGGEARVKGGGRARRFQLRPTRDGSVNDSRRVSQPSARVLIIRNAGRPMSSTVVVLQSTEGFELQSAGSLLAAEDLVLRHRGRGRAGWRRRAGGGRAFEGVTVEAREVEVASRGSCPVPDAVRSCWGELSRWPDGRERSSRTDSSRSSGRATT